ncbi:MAG TPA: transcriptional repressor [Anaeromyxobacteraceae bacterium]|jgi:Fur family ferric uptake transcriptional regulator
MTGRAEQGGNGEGRSRAAPGQPLELALARLGRRRSRQREAIARTFFAMGGHVPVEELVARVREADPRVSVATVYRTMKLLASSGLAVSRDFGDGRVRYETAAARRSRDHDHLVCTGCGAIVEFESYRVEALQRRLARRHGFEVERRHVELYGRCARCRGAGRGRTA